jgi:hypothetical protein
MLLAQKLNRCFELLWIGRSAIRKSEGPLDLLRGIPAHFITQPLSEER